MNALGQSLRDSAEKGLNTYAIAIIKLLIFTGARKGEIEALQWCEVDLEGRYLRLADSKTGQKIIPLNLAALEILKGVPKVFGQDYVFPALGGMNYYKGATKVWTIVRDMADLKDVRLHDLRHSFASLAVSDGASLPIIGALLGHADSATTQRYAHLHDDPLREASEAVGDQITAIFENEKVQVRKC